MLSSLQLARLCGVSQGTVDRAIHGRSGISEKTRARILMMAQKHGYAPNPAATEMMSGASRIVGAIVPRLNRTFFLDFFELIQQELSAAGLRAMLTSARTEDEFQEVLRDFAARRYRAAIVVPPRDHLEIPGTLTKQMSVISLISPCNGDNTFFISPNEQDTGRRAADYLIQLGHRRIAHITYSRDAYGIRARAEGYAMRIKQHQLTPAVHIFTNESSFMEMIRKQKPTALFCHNDWLALQAIRLLESANIKVPRDISVLGVDDSPTFTEIFPSLTTLRYPLATIAHDAVLRITDSARPQSSYPFEIVERQTVRRIES